MPFTCAGVRRSGVDAHAGNEVRRHVSETRTPPITGRIGPVPSGRGRTSPAGRRRTAVVRSRDPAHDTGAARVVLLDYHLGRSCDPHPGRCCRSTNRCLVSQVGADPQRRHRRRPTCALVPTGFIHVPVQHGDRPNLCHPPAKTYGHPLPCNVRCGNSSSGYVLMPGPA